MENKSVISMHTLLPVGLILTLLGAAFSFGVMYAKVDAMSHRLMVMEKKVDRLIDKRLVQNQIKFPNSKTLKN